jgi:hypothetical protein
MPDRGLGRNPVLRVVTIPELALASPAVASRIQMSFVADGEGQRLPDAGVGSAVLLAPRIVGHGTCPTVADRMPAH